MLRVDVLLLDLVIVLAAAKLFGWLARRLGQPPVIGEIVAGILLGPTLFGQWIGDDLFGPDMRPALTALADVGLILFMFVVGLELDQKLVRGKGKVAASVALGSTSVPFALGAVLALTLAADHANGKTLPFVLFMGAAMSATAFPVLARILTDREMQRTTLGGLALASAAVIDVLAWTALAVVVGIAGAEAASGQWQVLLAVPYAAVMFLVVRPLLARLVPAFERAGRLTPGLLSLVLLGLIGSAWATEWMHVHFIFGAFLFGAVMPREGAEHLNHQILERLEQLAVLLLLPMFFVVSGLSVNLRTLTVGSLGVLAGILAVAIGGKLIGSYLGARLQRVPSRQAAALATLLNTRGLTEIVILSVGLQKGVLDGELYSLMVLMALLTTAMTGPLLRRVYPDRRIARDIAEAERAALGVTAAYRVVTVIPGHPADAGPLAELAADLASAKAPAEVVLIHLQPYPQGRQKVTTGLFTELADMTETLGALEALAAGVRRRGVEARVVSRFSADPAGELPALAASARPDLVVVPREAPGYERIVAEATCRTVTVLPEAYAAGGPVAVHHGPGDAAAHVALQFALARSRPLLVLGRGKGTSLAQRLARLGVDAASAAEAPPEAFVVAHESVAPPGAHLLVRAEQDADPVDWSAVVPAKV
ncbi:cation:proton antiporter domain-containing protein [Sphaerisporangium perillae]|uniref:cation:proton antiporter domain-containing protein n=1 Tax=Sphaerisporangium perillae TaxID=2935860 RepID=UPI00200F51EB|nr:cation:proton antiporter [Sphaerisporangium perillae]